MVNTSQFSSPYQNFGGPFGDADAAKVDFTNLKRGLINFGIGSSNSGADDSFNVDVTTRIIFGKKGAGKTLYLKLIQDSCRKNNDEKTGTVYFTDIDNMPPDSRIIIKITNWLDEHKGMADEIWRRLWYVTILRTIVSHVFSKKDFYKYLDKNLKNAFATKYEPIMATNAVPVSIFRQLENIITKFNSARDLLAFLDLAEWAEFETEIGELLKELPPIYFFIDGIDDDYVNAPHHWLKCHFGLFNCIFRMLRSQLIGARLHVVVCLREFVYSYVLQTQHGNKYLAESKIKVLKWDKEMLKYFFEKKIELLNEKYFINPAGEKNIENLVGFQDFFNKRHNKNENVFQYIFRHTMLMPRDIINIGNLFCNGLPVKGHQTDLQALLKVAVHEVAKQIATEQLILAALLINTRWIYKDAIEHNNLESYTDNEILDATKENLKSLIKSIDKDRFSKKELLEIKSRLKQFSFDENDQPFTALYHCGLLGFVSKDFDDNDRIVSFSDLRTSEFNLPLSFNEYVFHSCLIDALNIKPIGDPVVF